MLAMPDEFSEAANRVLDMVTARGAFVAAIFPYELRNVLVTNERRGRIQFDQIMGAIERIEALPLHVVAALRHPELMAVARRHRLTVSDAAYLDIAINRRLPVATLDNRLAAAARSEGLSVITD